MGARAGTVQGLPLQAEECPPHVAKKSLPTRQAPLMQVPPLVQLPEEGQMFVFRAPLQPPVWACSQAGEAALPAEQSPPFSARAAAAAGVVACGPEAQMYASGITQ